MSILPVAFSLMASFMSAISLMGLTREIYMYGTQFLVINISYLVRPKIQVELICCYRYEELRTLLFHVLM